MNTSHSGYSWMQDPGSRVQETILDAAQINFLKIKRFEAKIPEDSSSRRIQISILVTILLKADIPESWIPSPRNNPRCGAQHFVKIKRPLGLDSRFVEKIIVTTQKNFYSCYSYEYFSQRIFLNPRTRVQETLLQSSMRRKLISWNKTFWGQDSRKFIVMTHLILL